MNALTKIFYYLFFSVLIGALIAPFAYWGISLLPVSESFYGHFIHSIQQMPFHRYESRSIQIAALVLLWPTLASLKIGLRDLNLFPNYKGLDDLLIGAISGIVPLWLLEAFLLGKGWYIFNSTFPLHLLVKILLTAAIVSLMEEFIFRGLLLGLFQQVFNRGSAIIVTALFFAGCHFFNFPHTNLEKVHLWSGLTILLQVGRSFPSSSLLFGTFLTLFLVGVILAWVTVKTKSLFLAIGLHGGWIFGQQFFNILAMYHIEPANALLPWLGPSQIYGMVPVGVITLIPFGITSLLLACWLKKR